MPDASGVTTVLVVYYSRYGVLRQLAQHIVQGVLQVPAAEASLLEVADEPIEQVRLGEDAQAMALRRAIVINRLTAADALIVGAPAYFGTMASPVKRLFEDCAAAVPPSTTDRSRPWLGHQFRDKVGAAFTASATPHGGNEAALHSILTMMMHLGMVIVTPGQHLPMLDQDSAPYGATAIAGADGRRVPDPKELDDARDLGHRVAEIALWLKRGKAARSPGQAGTLHAPADAARAARNPGAHP